MTQLIKQNSPVLITGGAGYIGSHLSCLLQKEGYKVTIYDNLSTGNASLIATSNLITADILDKPALVATLKKHQVKTVIHLAAKSSVPESFINPNEYFETNVNGTRNVVEACAEVGVKNFIFSSSAAVYGNATHGLVTEGAPLKPISPYGKNKLEAEQWVASLCSGYGIKQIIFRYFNVIGAHPEGTIGQYNPKSKHLLQSCFNCIHNKKPMEVFGNDYNTPDGTAERDYIHVQDLASLHLHAIQYLEGGGESLLLNAGYGNSHSVMNFIHTLQKVTRHTIEVSYVPRRHGDPASLISDVSCLNQTLDWIPEFNSLEQMIGSSWQWETSPIQKVLRCTA